MKKKIVIFLAILGALSLSLFLLFILGLIIAAGSKPGVDSHTVLELDLSNGVIEYQPSNPFTAITGKTISILEIVEGLKSAGKDPKISGLIVRLGAGGIGFAQTQEIRDSIIEFRKTGKFAYIFSESFGEMGPSTKVYYLATAFDKIYMQPSGDLGLVGFSVESMFLKGTLSILGIQPRMAHRKEYKNAMNMFTEEKFTKAHKESISSLIGGLFDQVVKGISNDRNIPVDQLKIIINNGPYSGAEAVKLKLIDELIYWDECLAKIKLKDQQGKLLFLSNYLKRTERVYAEGQMLALIYGLGAISRGESNYNPITNSSSIGANTMARAIRQAVKDIKIKGILLRIDSPGGSYVASDTVWREVVQAKKSGKPVVVSMGNLAASGGYFIAMPASKIVAQPGTITGSIGVVAGKMITKDFWGKLGITWDQYKTSTNADLWSSLNDFSDPQWNKFQKSLDRIYLDFTNKAAMGRNMNLKKMQEIAKGRVWTGRDALERGLIDELGGFVKAIELLKIECNIKKDANIKLEIFPKEKSFLEQLQKQEFNNSEEVQMYNIGLSSKIQLKKILQTIEKIQEHSQMKILELPFEINVN